VWNILVKTRGSLDGLCRGQGWERLII